MRLKLRVVSGLQVGDQRRIEPPGGIIGRAEGCALLLRDDSVSRSHVELRFEQGRWWAYQQSTRSPTLLDGAALASSPHALRDSGVLQVGAVAVEYAQEQAPVRAIEHESPPTMINVRRQLPTIQQAVLPQMAPLRAAEPPIPETPATLILRRRSQPAPPEAPPTLIRRPLVPATGSTATSSPAPPQRSVPPSPPAQQPDPTSEDIPELALAEDVARLEKERDQLRLERDQLTADLRRLTEENAALRALQGGGRRPAPERSEFAAQALRLLMPFCESLEQATEALQSGDASRARSLLREASFGLADLRDLFESD